jgi:hypothetical protein
LVASAYTVAQKPKEEEIMANQNIDRRSFLKGAAATAATVLRQAQHERKIIKRFQYGFRSP